MQKQRTARIAALILLAVAASASTDTPMGRLKEKELGAVVVQAMECGGVLERASHKQEPSDKALIICHDYFAVYHERSLRVAE